MKNLEGRANKDKCEWRRREINKLTGENTTLCTAPRDYFCDRKCGDVYNGKVTILCKYKPTLLQL